LFFVAFIFFACAAHNNLSFLIQNLLFLLLFTAISGFPILADNALKYKASAPCVHGFLKILGRKCRGVAGR
jgi:hypothetical protein